MADDRDSTKLCPKCDETRLITEFCRDKYRPDGLSCWCRSCRVANARRWDQRNPEKRKKISQESSLRNPNRWREWHENNPAKSKASKRRWRVNNADRVRELERQRRAANREAILARRRLYYRQNRSAHIGYVEGYRARKLAAPGVFTNTDIARIKQQQRNRCAYCRKRLARFHVDHIIPLMKGGSNHPSNLQLTCERCNRGKGAMDPLLFARRLGRLL